MSSPLKEFSLLLGLLASDPEAVGQKLGLKDYVWTNISLATCRQTDMANCNILSYHWDWKRPQFYTILMGQDRKSKALEFAVELDNQDPTDSDHVCFMFIVLNARGRAINARYLETFVKSRARTSERLEIKFKNSSDTPSDIQVGLKQCDESRAEDRKAASHVIARILAH